MRYVLLILAFCSMSAGAIMAQSTVSKEDAQKMVIGLYVVDIAVEVCDLELTKDQEKRLEFWIEWAEKQLNISDRKLDKTYDGMTEEASKDKAGFCAKATPIAQEAVKGLPPAM